MVFQNYKSTVLIDTNILIDVLQERSAFLGASSLIMQKIYNKEITGVLAAHTIPTIWYVLRKTHTDEDRRKLLISLCNFLSVAELDSDKILSALNRSDFSDFEDCLQEECANAVNADFIITRNPKDFEKSRIPVFTPEEFLQRAV